MVIFHSYVSLPEGIHNFQNETIILQQISPMLRRHPSSIAELLAALLRGVTARTAATPPAGSSADLGDGSCK